jgi:phytoene dehydrogenase-like protein
MWQRYLRNSGGTSYGIAATPDQSLLRRPGPTTGIPGLYLAGASTRTGHGITGVALGGTEAAALAAGAPSWPQPRAMRVPRKATATVGRSGG